MGKVRNTTLGIIVFSIAARVLWMLNGGNEVTPSVLTLFRADALAVGAWLALAAREPGGIRSLVPAAWITMAVTGLLLLPLLALHRRFLMIPEALLAWFFGAFLVIGVTDRGESRIGWLWNNAPMQTLGKYSYGMYVYQNLLIVLLAPALTTNDLILELESPMLGRLCYMAIMTMVTFGLAMSSWHLFESHFLKFKDHFAVSSDSHDSQRTNQSATHVAEITPATSQEKTLDSVPHVQDISG